MKRGMMGLTMAALTMVAASAAPAAAQDASDLAGTWELEHETPMGVTTVIVAFVQEGDSTVAMMGRGENAVAVGRVEFEGGQVTFPFDMRAVMASIRDGRDAPPRAERGEQAGARGGARTGAGGRAAAPPRGGRGVRGEGPQGPRAAGPPLFRGTLDGGEIRGNVIRPRDGGNPGPEMVLRRAGGY